MNKGKRGPVGLAINSSGFFSFKGKCTEHAFLPTEIRREEILRDDATKLYLLLKAKLAEDWFNVEKHFLALCLFRDYPDVAWELLEPTLTTCGRAARLLELCREWKSRVVHFNLPFLWISYQLLALSCLFKSRVIEWKL